MGGTEGTGVLRCAQDDGKTGNGENGQRREQKQIPFGDDNQKDNDKTGNDSTGNDRSNLGNDRSSTGNDRSSTGNDRSNLFLVR
jgi:hypothetical protein